jgi:hypothetical protein
MPTLDARELTRPADLAALVETLRSGRCAPREAELPPEPGCVNCGKCERLAEASLAPA